MVFMVSWLNAPYSLCLHFRSTDYGTTYTKLNLMPGTTIVVTSFYICPTNKKKVGGCVIEMILLSMGLLKMTVDLLL